MNISIIGSGVVGQATGMGLAASGNKVIFHDIDTRKLLTLRSQGYRVTENVLEAVTGSKIVFVCVPTPTVDNRIDLRYIQNCTKSIGKILRKTRKYVVVAFRSTIPPQTTRTKLVPYLEDYSALTAGEDFGVCMNPEFLREQSPLKDFLNPNRIVIGEYDKKSGDILQRIYCRYKCPIIRTNLDTAEMIKYASNLYLASKISFFNEIFMVCHKLGLDSDIVSETVSLDPRIGKYGVKGGKPFGGMCLPKDLTAFIDFAKSKGMNLKLLQAVADINQEMELYSSINQELQFRSVRS